MFQSLKILIVLFALLPQFSQAQDTYDAYDPFADYSDFEEASEEEADINFFKNGRFLSLGLLVGYRGFTSTLGQIHQGSPNFGVALNYFFDLKFALQFSYTFSDHAYDIRAGALSQSGNMEVSGAGFDVKYYLNTQNVSKGLASFNPYILLGYSNTNLTQTISGQADLRKNTIGAFDLGFGAEFPLMRGKMYLGFEGQYQLMNWPGENSKLVIDDGGSPVQIPLIPQGDAFRFLGSIGINF